VANAVLYGSINGVVAVPAMVSFVAIIFQARWRVLALQVSGVTPGHRAFRMMVGMSISFLQVLL